MRRYALLVATVTAVAPLQSGCRQPAPAATPAASPAASGATVDVAAVASQLAEFDAQCARVAARTWQASLCGPLVLVEPASRLAIANAPDPRGRFARSGTAYVGTLATDEPLANTAVDWHGQRWAMVMLPAPADTFNRLRLLGHESFHRIQPAIGVRLWTPLNAHLDERDARLWLRLELRALARAVTAPDGEARGALADALLFRATRNRLYAGSDTLETQLEVGEGMAEYAGVRFAMEALGRTKESVLEWSRARFERTATFTRSLGYGTGPALGFALDRFAPGWQARAREVRSLTGELAGAIGWSAPVDLASRAERRAAAYDHDRIASEEDARATARVARVAEYRARLVDGRVLVLRQRGLGGPFDPNTVVPLGDAGTVYPRRTFTAEWGTLRVIDGGALVSPDAGELRVAAPDEVRSGGSGLITGPGWELRLSDGWTLERGSRAGDWEVRRSAPLDEPTTAAPYGIMDTKSGDTIAWSSFRWRGTMMGQRVVERSVLQVPVRLTNAPDSLFLQLDTGSDQSMFYEVPYRELRAHLPATLPRFVFERASVGAASLDGDTIWLRPASGRPIASTRARTIGTLGADVLRRRVLLLDFASQRFALLSPGAVVPAELERQARWTMLVARDGKLFVRARVAGVERDDLFFDSGSSAFPLVVRREVWREWTGRQPADPANDVWMATSWGREVPLIGAPLRGSMTIAGMEFASPMTFFHGDTAGPPGFFETSGYPVTGYFGNALFGDSAIVIIDVPRARFGVIAPALPLRPQSGPRERTRASKEEL